MLRSFQASPGKSAIVKPVVTATKKITKKKKVFLERLNLDGVTEYSKAKEKAERAFWIAIIILAYLTAAYLSYKTAERYIVLRTIVSVEPNLPTHTVFFPHGFTVCHTATWNRTYMTKNLAIPPWIMEKAALLGLQTQSDVMEEFAQYIKYYNFIHVPDQPQSPGLWELMNDLYQVNFATIHFADFIADATFNPSILKCAFHTHPMECDAIPAIIDMPSCYVIRISTSMKSRHFKKFDEETSKVDIARFTINIKIPVKDLFPADQENQGIAIMNTASPSVFTPKIVAPANTHAVVLFHHKEQKLIECMDGTWTQYDDLKWYKTYDVCLGVNFLNESLYTCGCQFITSGLYPRNKKICSPKMIKECVQPNIVEPVFGSVEESHKIKKNCTKRCWTDDVVASVTYYNLENTNPDTMENIITLRPNLDQGSMATEQILTTNIYAMFSEVGGVVGVYTGLSIAAFVRVAVLIGLHWIALFDKKILKPTIAKYMPWTPLSILWDMQTVLINRRKVINANGQE